MTEEAKIIWGGELWAPPTILQEVDNHWLVGAYLSRHFIEGKYTVPLYTTPPAAQRTWVGLTDDQRTSAIWSSGGFGAGALWAEKQIKENNE
jgi:hypothetical protein